MNGDSGGRSLLKLAERAGLFVENSLLVIILSSMMLLGSAQILLRNFAGSGFSWADEALRLMVLWIAMLGAVAASRDYRHISIDVLTRFLPDRGKAWASAVIDLYTAAVSMALAWFSWVFVADSYEYQDVLLGDLPAWIFQVILPVGFALIAYRYVIWTASRMQAILHGGSAS